MARGLRRPAECRGRFLRQVNKYRKWLAREGLGSREGGEEARDAAAEQVQRAKPESEEEEQGGEEARPKPQKRKSALHRLHEKVQAEKQAQREEQDQVPLRPPPISVVGSRLEGDLGFCRAADLLCLLRLRG